MLTLYPATLLDSIVSSRRFLWIHWNFVHMQPYLLIKAVLFLFFQSVWLLFIFLALLHWSEPKCWTEVLGVDSPCFVSACTSYTLFLNMWPFTVVAFGELSLLISTFKMKKYYFENLHDMIFLALYSRNFVLCGTCLLTLILWYIDGNRYGSFCPSS